MIKVLEKFGGERVLLICEKTEQIKPDMKLRLLGKNLELIVEEYHICTQRECFSTPKTTNIILSPKYTIDDLNGITDIEVI